jgi:sigma-B regulation protein RsbU (phosphoserine phosphatase)
MVPAKEVAGDLFDFFLLDDHRLGIVIGDVSGKGVPAALFMAVSRTLLRASAQHQQSPGDCFTYVNDTLVEQNIASMFVTLFYGVLDLRTGALEYANGGHNPAYVFSPFGTTRTIEGKSGPVLGIFGGARYGTLTDQLQPGESLLLYTDGVTEARSNTGGFLGDEFFGEVRLESFIAGHASKRAEDLTASLLKAVQAFASGAPQSDDITVLVLRYLG